MRSDSRIPANAKFPPQIKTIEDALGAIDMAYHMNHRINGKFFSTDKQEKCPRE